VAELEIAPEHRQFVGPSPSFPSSTPVQEEIQRSAQQTDATLHRASTLLAAIMKQRESLAGDQAQLDFANQVDALETNLINIQDIPTRSRMYTEGVNSIVDGLNKQYPGMSPTVAKTIGVAASHYKRQYYLKGVTDLTHQHAADFKAYLKNLSKTAALAKSDAESHALLKNGLDAIDREAQSGLISPNEAALAKTTFLHDTKLEQANYLLEQATHPVNPNLQSEQALMNLTPENSGLHPQELQNLNEKLLHYQNQVLMKGNQEYTQRQAQNYDRLVKGQQTPQQFIKNGGSPEKAKTVVSGFVPSPEVDTGIVDNFVADMHTITNLHDLADWEAHKLDTATMTPTTRAAIKNEVDQYKKELGTVSGKEDVDLASRYREEFATLDPDFGTSYDENKQLYIDSENELKASLKTAKDISEKYKILNDSLQSIYKHFAPDIDAMAKAFVRRGRPIPPQIKQMLKKVQPYLPKESTAPTTTPTPKLIPKPTPEATGPTPSAEPIPAPEPTPGAYATPPGFKGEYIDGHPIGYLGHGSAPPTIESAGGTKIISDEPTAVPTVHITPTVHIHNAPTEIHNAPAGGGAEIKPMVGGEPEAEMRAEPTPGYTEEDELK